MLRNSPFKPQGQFQNSCLYDLTKAPYVQHSITPLPHHEVAPALILPGEPIDHIVAFIKKNFN